MNGLLFAWRNLSRNRLRTRISLGAIAFSTAVLIIANALTAGMVEEVVRTVIDLGTGEVQVHAKGFITDRSIHTKIGRADEIRRTAADAGLSVAQRSLGSGLVATGDRAAGVQFWGVDPQEERALGALPSHLQSGMFLDAPDGRKLVLGSKVAKTLGVGPGAKVALILSAADDSITTEMFEVAGVLAPIGQSIDTTAVFVARKDFAELFSTDAIHEIAVSSHGRVAPEGTARILARVSGDADVKTWKELLPNVGGAVDMIKSSTFIVGAILLFAAGLGVLNTMLMSAYERIPEFGVIKALGATPRRIVADIAREALVLGVIGTLVGGIVGVAASWAVHRWGLDIGSLAVSGVGLSGAWRAKLSIDGVVVPVLVMLLAALVAALYPASKAARLDPIKAIQHV